jgi:protein MPE1
VDSIINFYDWLVLNLFSWSEYKDDSQIIPRSSSVIVRRLPSSRPGKGKAAMYIAGVGNAPAPAASDPSQRHVGPIGNSLSWHKGSMSKRFDGKEESPSIAKPLVVCIMPNFL